MISYYDEAEAELRRFAALFYPDRKTGMRWFAWGIRITTYVFINYKCFNSPILNVDVLHQLMCRF